MPPMATVAPMGGVPAMGGVPSIGGGVGGVPGMGLVPAEMMCGLPGALPGAPLQAQVCVAPIPIGPAPDDPQGMNVQALVMARADQQPSALTLNALKEKLAKLVGHTLVSGQALRGRW